MKIQTKKKLLIIAFILSLAFVWGQSSINKKHSETVSDVFVNVIKPLEEIKPNDVYTAEYEYYSRLIRKGAHVAEFTIIGAELALIILLFSNRKQKAIVVFVNAFMVGMLIGLIDETIQIFSDRGSQVSDVWFDVIGIGIGAGVVSIMYFIKKRKRKYKII